MNSNDDGRIEIIEQPNIMDDREHKLYEQIRTEEDNGDFRILRIDKHEEQVWPKGNLNSNFTV